MKTKEQVLCETVIRGSKLFSDVVDRIGARTAEEQTVLTEFLLRELCWQSIESYEVISFLTGLGGGHAVNVKQVMALDLAPTRESLSEEQEKAVAVATIFYGVFKATTELAACEKAVNAEGVFGWLRDLVKKRDDNKGPFDPASAYRAKTIEVLEELAK